VTSSGPPIHLREAAAADRERVRAFYVASGHSGLLAPADRLLVAERGSEIVGAVRLCVEEGVQVLRTMRVHPDLQRQGLGRRMLLHFETMLAGAECYCLPYAHLERFYGTIGFARVEPDALPPHLAARLGGYLRERPNAIAMRRPVTRALLALSTARLRLRRMAPADADEFERQWNQPEVGRYLWDGQPVPRARVEEVIASSADTFAARGFGLWTVTLAADGRVAGFCGLRVEESTGRVELLYAFDAAWWGRGLATEAARAVLADAFTRPGLSAIYAGTNPNNRASSRVLDALGMRRVGVRQTPREELLIYARERPYDPATSMEPPSARARLATQLEGLALLLGDAGAEALRRPSPSGKWSAHDNLAHIARQHEVFLERVRRILAEDAPALPQYRAEDDAAWPAWRALSTEEVRGRLHALRAELLRVVERLSPAELGRSGVHSRFGALSLAAWLEFFLVHEAHHLYTILRRARGID
jgi:RimJ/RimL family protein N-acetyltransferase/GNAT superfamily N-acetyltransferase